ncbi:MAG: TRAP transporter large permease subunit, partial [Rhodocyclaceae bacterium]|nr:TRAP transporter large permease subunit [Rhodocyclaceae bacterium]
LGTIFLGIATPTEGGAMGALGALIMAVSRRRLSVKLLTQAMDATTKLSAFVLFILLGATVFSLTFQAVDGHIWVEHLLTGLPGGQIGFLVVVNVLIFILAFFLDFFELAFIVLPLLAPVADKLGIDLVWFGILMAVNMQTSFMHPPFGFALFYLRSVAPHADYIDKVTKKKTARVTTGQIYWGAVPFVVIQVIMVGILIAFPGIVTGSIDKTKQLSAEEVRLQFEGAGGVDPSYGTPGLPSGWGEEPNGPAAGDLKTDALDSLDPPVDAKAADAKADDPAAALMQEVVKDKKIR